jgi:UDP-N-acetylmuramoyl-tripeptide--D-alanyl-D-alanine ligase
MIELRLSEIAEAVGGQLVGPDQTVSGSVETDSRLVSTGALFVAKPGEVTDGHLFLHAAQQAGAIGAIVQKQNNEVSLSQIVVSDSVVALGVLAAHVLKLRRKLNEFTVIGITGSNGKTSTKNMLREVLSRFGETVAPIESYNNEVGAPISILKVTTKTRYLVVELGADGLGSIDYLTKMCEPDIGVVLKVGLAHVGEFGDIDTTFKIKSELAEGLKPGAKLLLNADDPFVTRMSDITRAQVHWFGTTEGVEYSASNISVSLSGTTFDLRCGSIERKVKLNILGEHQVMNALAALGVANLLNLDIEVAAAALEAMPLAERWRMQVLPGINGSIVINDAYNASPDSMKAALQTLATLGRQGHRTVAILGEMAELGKYSVEEHDAIGRLAVRLNIDQVVVVGDGAKIIHMGASQEGSWDGESKFFPSISDALPYLRGLLGDDDVVLVKSSNSAGLRVLGDALAEVNK